MTEGYITQSLLAPLTLTTMSIGAPKPQIQWQAMPTSSHIPDSWAHEMEWLYRLNMAHRLYVSYLRYRAVSLHLMLEEGHLH